MTTRQFAILTIVGGALAVAGSLLPWASVSSGFGTLSVLGTDGDGILTLGVGAVAALLGFIRYGSPRPWHHWATAGLGILILFLGAQTWFSLAQGTGGNDTVRSSIGVGLYVVLLGGLATLLSGTKGKPEPTSPPTPPTSSQPG